MKTEKPAPKYSEIDDIEYSSKNNRGTFKNKFNKLTKKQT